VFPVAARVELKYAVTEDDVERVLRFARLFVAEDPACPSAGGQRVTSLYLDTPRGDFFGRHVARDADRFKLRVRRYGDDDPEVVFFEIKRKVGHVGEKRRARVPAAEAGALLARGRAGAAGSATPDGENLQLFLLLTALHRAAPRMLVSCRRESWVGRQPGANPRVTFDRELAYQPVDVATLRGDPGRWSRTPIESGSVVLELKYTGAPPWWMAELARRLGRRRTGYSKYVAAVADSTAGPLRDRAGLEGLA
jgi:hypothetical protein